MREDHCDQLAGAMREILALGVCGQLDNETAFEFTDRATEFFEYTMSVRRRLGKPSLSLVE